jgi:mono/diheme cytochrome c family protein
MFSKRIMWVPILGCSLFVGIGAEAAETAIENGEYLAIRHCMDCHEIAPGHASVKLVKKAPPFAALANDPEKGNEAYLKKILGAGSHSLMLEHAGGMLDKNQINSIIQYILSLKKS